MRRSITWKSIMLILFLFSWGITLYAQQVSGTIYSDGGNSTLSGVTIHVLGSQNGSISDARGKYQISGVKASDSLIFSSVGYSNQSVLVGDKTTIDVKMSPIASDLDQVVVIGYGTAKKKDLTGSVAHLDANNFRNSGLTQLSEYLSGTVSGVSMTQATGASGGGSLLIRGRKSLSANNDPLIVLDGAIYDGDLSDINPSDIESIDIMKDASSAAIYGASAAGGVVLVTTKRGKKGKPVINVTTKVGLSNTTHDLKTFGPLGYLNMHRDYWTQASVRGNDEPYGYYYSPHDLPMDITLDQWRSWSTNPGNLSDDEIWLGRLGAFPIEIENYKEGKTEDFYKRVIRKALRQDYSLSISGASDVVNYYFSSEFLNNKGIIRGDEFEGIRLRLNLDVDVTNWLKIGTHTQFGSRDQSTTPGDLGLLELQSPYGSMYNEDGSLRKFTNDYTAVRNPLENYYNQDRLNRTNSLFSNIYAEVELPFGFNFKASYQPDFSFQKDYNFWDPNTTEGGTNHNGGFGRRLDMQSFGWRMDNILNWGKKFGKHEFAFTGLITAEVHKDWSSTQEASDFKPLDILGFNALQFGQNPNLIDNDTWESGNSLMARLNYSYNGRYLITLSDRRDGYSAFGQENPHANFPSAAIGWVLSEENFFNSNLINFLKVRYSIGANGNRRIGAYAALAQMGSVLNYDGSKTNTGVFSNKMPNSTLKWEKTISNNLGIDLNLLNNKLDFSLDIYKSKTTDLLMNRILPILTGYSQVATNLGELQNKGINISLQSINIQNENFKWSSDFEFTLNRNKITKLFGDFGGYKILGKDMEGELPDFINGWFVGQASDIVWDYKVLGVWQLDQKDEANKYGLDPGDWRVLDRNKDSKLLQFDDKEFIGHTVPQYSLGLRNDFTLLKNLTISIFLRADLDYLRDIPDLTTNKSSLDRTNIYSWGYWSIENPTNDFARYIFPDNSGLYEGTMKIYKPTGFFRLQDLSISYNVPMRKVLDRVGIQEIRVFGSGHNLLTATKWPGFDPESGMIPMPRSFTLGVNISL